MRARARAIFMRTYRKITKTSPPAPAPTQIMAKLTNQILEHIHTHQTSTNTSPLKSLQSVGALA